MSFQTILVKHNSDILSQQSEDCQIKYVTITK